MKRLIQISITILLVFLCFGHGRAQSVTLQQQLEQSMESLQSQPNLRHASIGLCVLDAQTGRLIYGYNQDMGLAPASCLKTVTAITALNVLTDTFHFRTSVYAEGSLVHHHLMGNLRVTGSGDPTLGSWRYQQTKPQAVFTELSGFVRNAGIQDIHGAIYIDHSSYTSQSIPDGWIWQDIGNYYGAGGNALVYRENQYDVHLRPGTYSGAKTQFLGTVPEDLGLQFRNEVTTGPRGSGDNTYIYFKPASPVIYLRGTAPLGDTEFTVTGSLPDPEDLFIRQWKQTLKKSGVHFLPYASETKPAKSSLTVTPKVLLGVYTSPTLDSICYWMLKRSINLYAEQLLKTLAIRATGTARTDSGVRFLTEFWKTRGIDPASLNLVDGSGLSPENRITPLSLAQILYSAQNKSWFEHFYADLPIIHNLHMKSGYIQGVRSYAGWVTGQSGKKYVFAFILNNIYGDSIPTMYQMWKILDILHS